MKEMIKILVGILVLVLGYFIGNFMRNETKDELKDGKKYFKILVTLGLLSGIVGLVISKDWLMFTGFFIAIVTSRSLILKK
jgi:hypothetical protein